MRTNLPITQNEYRLPEGITIVSITDLRGHITSANADFIEASGFTWEELEGQPHNILRHLDVPAAVFEDFWRTLRRGLPWSQIVKNRRKNGDHYWVEARATPMFEKGKVVGYLSVRTPATREQVALAERVYPLIEAGKLKIEGGRIVGRLEPLNRFVRRFNLANIVTFFLVIMTLLPVLGELFGERLPFALEAGIGVATIVILYFFLRGVSEQLAGYARTLRELSEGEFRGAVEVFADAPYESLSSRNQIGASLRSVQVNLGYSLYETRHNLDEAMRVQAALNTATANVMVADRQNNIVFMNEAVKKMFKGREERLRQALPDFRADQVLGKNVDIFHAHPEHQQKMIAGLKAPHVAKVEVAGLTMQLTMAPVISTDGRRLGTVVEWVDQTQLLSIEARIGQLIEAAARGNLANQVETEDLDGFYLSMAQNVNMLVLNLNQVIQAVVRVAMAMADGDLTQQVEGEFDGDLLMLQNAINRVVENLGETLSSINMSSDAIKTATSEVAQGSLDLSQRTQEQAASLEETAASMEQMTATVKQNTDAAMQASQLAAQARNKADEGGAVVNKAKAAMQAIIESSEKISAIISLIDGIAFQTNLLALNAAVEAARAGEHGRGFAVVAGEVRSLAQKSAEASREIKGLITSSTTSVSEGADFVEQTVASLVEINDSIRKVNDIVSEIAAASSEQATGIEQVNQAIMQMDSVTQQNAALVEETSAASGSMDAQVEEMVQAIRFFKTADHQRENVMLSRSSPQGAALMRAKDAHAKFLNRMQAMYRGAIPVQKLSDHHSCAFGQWFDEQGREMLEETGVATKIDELHAQFHGFGNQMIASLEQGDREAAGAALVSARGLSEVLIELFDQTARSFAMPSHQTKASLKPLKASMPAKSQAASAKASSAKSAKAEKKTPAAAKDEWDEF